MKLEKSDGHMFSFQSNVIKRPTFRISKGIYSETTMQPFRFMLLLVKDKNVMITQMDINTVKISRLFSAPKSFEILKGSKSRSQNGCQH